MVKTSSTNTVAEETAVNTVVDTTAEMNEEMNEEAKKAKNETVKAKQPLDKFDEIEVISLVPNVSYKDSKTYDMYEWDNVGHVEYMTVETLDNMWRSNKGYFKNLWLKPNDERVINKFGLTKTFKEYEYLMNGSNYTKKNVDKICDAIANTPNSLKLSICDKVKSLVISGEVVDVFVIRALENRLKINLIDFL